MNPFKFVLSFIAFIGNLFAKVKAKKAAKRLALKIKQSAYLEALRVETALKNEDDATRPVVAAKYGQAVLLPGQPGYDEPYSWEKNCPTISKE